MSKKLIRNIVLAVVILIVGLVLKNKLSGMATKVEIKEDKTAPLVNVFTASPDTVGLGLELYGKLNAINRVDVLAEVSAGSPTRIKLLEGSAKTKVMRSSLRVLPPRVESVVVPTRPASSTIKVVFFKLLLANTKVAVPPLPTRGRYNERWMVCAFDSVAPERTFAARPVGAINTTLRLCFLCVATTLRITVVFPVPAYPLIIKTSGSTLRILR